MNKKTLIFLFFLMLGTTKMAYSQESFTVSTKQYMSYKERHEPQITAILNNLHISIYISPKVIKIENDRTEQFIDYPINRVDKGLDGYSMMYYCNPYDCVLIKYPNKLEILNLIHGISKVYYFNEALNAPSVVEKEGNQR